MKMGSLFLGSASAAAVLTATSAAMAADAPMAMSREPVYRCEDTGFWELPGTDTCLKIGGHMRFVAGYHEDNLQDDYAATYSLFLDDNGDPIGAAQHLQRDTFFMTAYGRFNLDARTQTEYGLLRGFAEFEATDGNTSTSGPLELRHAYVQIGNWLFGKTDTIFGGVLNYNSHFGSQGMITDSYPRVVQARYTQEFGNGFSFAVALEDPQRHTIDVYLDPVLDSRNETPALTAALNASGDWGSAMVGGYIVDHSVTQDGDAITPGVQSLNSEHEIGWAALASVSVNVPTGEGDALSAQAMYTDGIGNLSNGSQSTSIWLNSAGSYETIEFWGATVTFRHYWTPSLNSSVGVSYGEWDYNESAADIVAGTLDLLTDNEANAFANIVWTPVANLDVSLEAWYAERELMNGNDDDALSVAVEITRSF